MMSGNYEHLRSVSFVHVVCVCCVFKALVLYAVLKCSLYNAVSNCCYWQLQSVRWSQTSFWSILHSVFLSKL